MMRSKVLLASASVLLMALTATAAPAAPAAPAATAALAPNATALGPGPAGALPVPTDDKVLSIDDLPVLPSSPPVTAELTPEEIAATEALFAGSGSSVAAVPAPAELTPEEIAATEALFAGASADEETSEERKVREKAEKKERKRKEKEEKKRKEKEKEEKEEKKRKEKEKEEKEEKERLQKEEEQILKEIEASETKGSEEQKQREEAGSSGKDENEEKKEKESAERNANASGETPSVDSVKEDTPIVSKSTNSGLDVTESFPPTIPLAPAAQPQPQPQPQAAPYTAASSWLPASQGIPALDTAQAPLGQPRNGNNGAPTFTFSGTSVFPSPSLQPVAPSGNGMTLPDGRTTTTVFPAPVPREKIISRYLHDVFKYADTNQLLDNMKRGQPLPPLDYNGVTVNFKVIGFDGKPVTNQAGPWTSQQYTAPPAPIPVSAAPVPAAPAPAPAAAPTDGLVSPMYFLNVQGKVLPVYDSTAETTTVLKQLREINQMQAQWQRQLQEAQAELAQQHQLQEAQAEVAHQQQQQQPTLYHRPTSPAQDAEVFQVPVPTVLKSDGSGKYLQPIKTSTATITIPAATAEEHRGLASAEMLQPIPGSSAIFSIQGPTTVVANQGASSAWQSYSSATSADSPTSSASAYSAPAAPAPAAPAALSAAYSAPAASASAAPASVYSGPAVSVTPNAYSGVVTPGVPESLAQFAQAQDGAHAAPHAAPHAAAAAPAEPQPAAGGAPVRVGLPIPGAEAGGAPHTQFGAPQVLSLTLGPSSASSSGVSAVPPYTQYGVPQVLTFSSNPGAANAQVSPYSQGGAAQVLTFSSAGLSPSPAPAGLSPSSAAGNTAVIKQLPTSYSTAYPYAQQQAQPWAQPYTVSVYATQTKA